MRRKLGLQQADKRDDESRIADLFAALQDQKTDFTLFFRNLSEVSNTLMAASGARLTTIAASVPIGSATTTISFDDKQLQDILAGAAALPPSDLATHTSLFKASKIGRAHV